MKNKVEKEQNRMKEFRKERKKKRKKSSVWYFANSFLLPFELRSLHQTFSSKLETMLKFAFSRISVL